MVRKVRMIASGSSGNCTFVRLGDTRLLIDVGVSLRRVEAALQEFGESVAALSAVVITHEHSDHVSGLPRLLARYPDLPILATSGTLRALDLPGAVDVLRLKAGRARTLPGVDIIPFAVSHDAAEPIGLRLEAGEFAMGIATDLGVWTDEVVEALHGCPFVIVESNYDPEMLHHGPYPEFLKRRVASSRGHLANGQARALLARIADPVMECVVLAHLSEKNNTAALALRSANAVLAGGGVRVCAAGRKGSELFEPGGTAVFGGPPRQLNLF